MANYVNPLSSVAGYRNQQLAPLIAQQGSSVMPSPGMSQSLARERMAQSPSQANALSGIQSVSDSASRQHQLRLQAIQKKIDNEKAAEAEAEAAARAAAAARRPQQSYVGAPAAVSSPGNPKGLVGQFKLLPGADQAYQSLNAQFQQQFGYALPVASGGRTYADQQYLYNLYLQGKGNLAAKPGTSEHESGRAIDFGGAAHNYGTRENQWLIANAGNYGFKWTGKNFSQFEPWHFEWWG